MPELPEVEVLKRSLEPLLVGRRLGAVEVRDSRLREPAREKRLARECSGRRISGLRRRSKYLLADLEGGTTLVVHLGMSGRLTLSPASEAPHKHEHVVFDVLEPRARRARWKLRFRDPRRFGLVLALATAKLDRDRHFAHLGLEPLSERFTAHALEQRARGRRAPVKAFLMDATQVVGIGNIYASESLFRAGVHPLRKAGRIASSRWQGIAESVSSVLTDAIRQGGTTLNDFADGNGNSGYFQVALDVYDREGEPCRRCRRRILRKTLSNRSTYYCPGCQR